MAGPTPSIPCRLYVLLARSAPVGVVFRRGPTKWVQLIKWDTDADSFEQGQWFNGRIYERRCDLSPDGSKLIYFASKLNSHTLNDSEYTYAWTAISKPPYFTALALWPKGDCWHGGGLFEDNRTVWLNHKPEVTKPHPEHKPRGLKIIPNPQACGEDEPVYKRRLIRDGWVLKKEGSYRYARGGWQTEQSQVWQKVNQANGLTLVMELVEMNFSKVGGPYVEQFSLIKDGLAIPVGLADWADWDYCNRLVVARKGKLFEGCIGRDEMEWRELADFNSNRPAPKATPGRGKAGESRPQH
jgi:hypothetical protein